MQGRAAGWLLALALLPGTVAPARAEEPLALVPWPASVQREAGGFMLSPSTRLHAADAAARANAELLNAWLRETHGWQLRWADAPPDDDASDVLRFETADAEGGAEAYALRIDARQVRISGSAAGQFYGVQTLLQLLPSEASPRLRLPALRIEDAPRFAYRGMHLDVGRHLYPPDFIKKLLDRMAHYKLNRFHWHLTEDQGWRIEIKRHPRLTGVGAWRRETVKDRQLDPYVGDGQPYGGFYTQEQVKEIVAYAAERHITVVPEIELPGHSLAALAAYPELACTPGPFEVGTTWGVYDDIYCPKEETFAFLQDVLDEVVALFPGEYVHIGGDEAPKTRWKESPVAQEVIRREGLKDEHELQSWFIRRIQRHLQSRGKRIIGWDEILEGGLAPGATVMSWRGEAGGIAAARQGHDVIMTPTHCCYFDYGQGPKEGERWGLGGELTLPKVYAYDPVPAVLAPEQRRHVLGVQANVWTEYLKRPEQVEYMVFPRLLALAEVAWTPQQRRDFDDFRRRLSPQYPRLARAGIGYRIPAPDGLQDTLLVRQSRHRLSLRSPVPGATLHYTLDGRVPDAASPVHRGPLALEIPLGASRTVRTLTVAPDGRESGIHAATFRNVDYLPASALPAGAKPGVRYRVREGAFSDTDQLRTAPSLAEGAAQAFDWRLAGRERAFGLEFEGWLHVPEDGVYRFATRADDASTLRIDGEEVVRNRSHDLVVEGRVALRRGWHRLRLDYYQRYGGVGLEVWWARDDAEPVPLDASTLRH